MPYLLPNLNCQSTQYNITATVSNNIHTENCKVISHTLTNLLLTQLLTSDTSLLPNVVSNGDTFDIAVGNDRYLYRVCNDTDSVDIDRLAALWRSTTMNCNPRHAGADSLATQVDSVANTSHTRETVRPSLHCTACPVYLLALHLKCLFKQCMKSPASV